MGDAPTTLDLLAIGERIRGLRTRQRTQQEFADLLGSSRMSVVRYEAGARTPDAEFLANLHKATGADVMWVLTGDGAAPAAAPLALTAEEEQLLGYFRDASKDVRKAVMGALMGVASAAVQQSGAVNQNVSGSGNVVAGRDVQGGPRPRKQR